MLICNQTSVKNQCFKASDKCVCELYGKLCTQYHLAECEKRVQTKSQNKHFIEFHKNFNISAKL
jgi:hypothetical protein